MPKRTNTALALAALIGMAGCVPLPHSITTVPEIQGVPVSKDRPLANTVVFFGRNPNWGKPCEGSAAEIVGRTDANGNFQIQQRRETQFFYSYTPGFDATPTGGQTTIICFESDGARIFGMELVYLRMDQQAFALTCNTSYHSISSSGVPDMICRAKAMPIAAQ